MENNKFSNNFEKGTQQINDDLPETDSHKLDKQQKISLAIIAVIGIGVLVLGFWQLRRIVEIPLPDFSKDSQQSQITLDPRDETLKLQDSDDDGLTDYDEIYVYNTSPYLKDSDSDGYLDREEIENGYDPNCPSGQNCFNETFVEPNEFAPGTVPPSVSAPSQTQMSPDQIREQLLSTGLVDKDTLNTVDDETLMEYYSQTIEGQEEVAAPETTTTNDINNYSAAQVRQLLIDSGLSKEEVDLIDDDSLMQMYQESLAEAQKLQAVQ